MRKNVMELIGTFFLVMAISFTGDPLSIGLMLAVMVYCGGHVSGAHYNPAVTAAVLLRKGIDLKTAAGYWVSQIIGAALAALVHYVVLTDSFAPAPGEGITFGIALLIETLGTFALALVVLNVATARKLAGNFIYGLAIGLTITAVASFGGDISGGVFNPAVAIGPAIIDVLTSNAQGFHHAVLYLAGPLLGAAFASFIFGYTNEE